MSVETSREIALQSFLLAIGVTIGRLARRRLTLFIFWAMFGLDFLRFLLLRG